MEDLLPVLDTLVKAGTVVFVLVITWRALLWYERHVETKRVALKEEKAELDDEKRQLTAIRSEMIERQDAKIKELEQRIERSSSACEKQMEKLRRMCEEDTGRLQKQITVLSRIVNRYAEDDRLDDSPTVG